MKTYLITGGCGFIGSNFIKYLFKKYDEIEVINLDALTYAGNLENLREFEGKTNYHFIKGSITDAVLVKSIFDDYDIDYVVNFAAESHVDRSILDPLCFVETNIVGTAVLLNQAKQSWQTDSGFLPNKKFLQISTDEVYGALGESGFFTEDTPLDPHSPYSASKTSADLLVKAFFDTYGFPMNITRCSNNYGPNQFPEKLIPLTFNNCVNLKNIPIYGDGKQIRDWLYVMDHCSAIDLVLHKAEIGQIYNIGGHNEKENIYIVKSIINYVRANINKMCSEDLITYVKDRLGHDRRYAIDPSKIHRDLGWQPSICFDDGIVMTLDWYKDNQDWVEHIVSGEYQDYYKKMYWEE